MGIKQCFIHTTLPRIILRSRKNLTDVKQSSIWLMVGQVIYKMKPAGSWLAFMHCCTCRWRLSLFSLTSQRLCQLAKLQGNERGLQSITDVVDFAGVALLSLIGHHTPARGRCPLL